MMRKFGYKAGCNVQQPQKIAVIGAGIAGLSCATQLQNAGLDVTIFEKSRGVSGRLSTRLKTSINTVDSWQCDHGAQYFTARDPLFNAEVQRWINANVAKIWQPNLQVFDGKTFTAKTGDTARYVGYPSNTSPAKWLASALNVQLQTTIISLQKHNDKWQIYSKEHGLYTEQFDAVLLAIPAPQAAVLLQHIAPTLYDLAAKVNMQACFALMLNFNQKLAIDYDGLFINSGILSWAARDSAKPGRLHNNSTQETWVLHASSQWSDTHVEDDKEAIAQQMLAEFKRINSSAATPNNHTLHRWLYADCAEYLQLTCEYDSQQNIGLCGDWLNGGKVQGAWISGLMLAQQMKAN